jgi:CheY-like chemotaxis protein
VSHRILVVDDEQGIRAALGQLLEYEGYEVRSESSAPAGIATFEKWRPHLTFLDVKMAGMDGLEGLKRIRQIDPTESVVRISGHATIQTAVELLLLSLILIVLLGTIINMKLSTSIAGPIRKLERMTGKIAAGDFSESIEVHGKDEIASLGMSFNQMEVKLKDALNSLERAIVVLGETVPAGRGRLASIGLLVAGVAPR